jgi:hypothetical protein
MILICINVYNYVINGFNIRIGNEKTLATMLPHESSRVATS